MTHAEKERILLDLLPLIRATAAKFCRRVFIDREEAIQEASIAAWQALDTFQPESGNRPWTYLYRRVVGAMLDYARYKSHPLGSTRFHKHKRLISLSMVTYDGDTPTTLGTTVADHRRGSMQALEEQEAFEDVLKHVQPRERRLLTLAFRDDEKQCEIGRREGLSASRIQQVFKATLARLRATTKGN